MKTSERGSIGNFLVLVLLTAVFLLMGYGLFKELVPKETQTAVCLSAVSTVVFLAVWGICHALWKAAKG